MWPFSSSDDRGQGESEGGFLSGLWTAVKWVAIAAAAVLTLGAVFKFSPTVKNFVDGFTGGEGEGLATKAVGLLDGAVDKVKSFFNPVPDKKELGKTVEIRGNQILPLDASLTTADVAVKNAEYKDVEDMRGSLTLINSSRNAMGDIPGMKTELFRKREAVLRQGLIIEATNGAITDYLATHPDYKGKGIPTPPIVELKLPPIPTSLNDLGKKQVSNWESMSHLTKFQTLEKQFDPRMDQILRGEKLLDQWKASGEGWDGVKEALQRGQGLPERGSITEDKVIKLFTSPFDDVGTAGRLINSYRDSAIAMRTAVEKLIKEERFEEAEIVASTASKYFSKLNIELDKKEAGKENKDRDRTAGTYIADATKKFSQLREYVVLVQEQKVFDDYSNQVYPAVNTAIRNAQAAGAAYQQQVKDYKDSGKLVTTSSAPATDNAAGAGSAQAAAAKAGAATPAPDAAAKTTASLAPTQENAARLAAILRGQENPPSAAPVAAVASKGFNEQLNAYLQKEYPSSSVTTGFVDTTLAVPQGGLPGTAPTQGTIIAAKR